MTDTEDLAKEAVGHIYVWPRAVWDLFKEHPPVEIADMTKWCVCTNWRGDGNGGVSLYDQANAESVFEDLNAYEHDQVVFDHVYHWGSCIFVRIWDEAGEITQAFQTLAELIDASSDGYIDDSKYFELEWEALKSAIESQGHRFLDDQYGKNPRWTNAVADWLNTFAPDDELENRDGTGAWPSEEWVELALYDLEIADDETTDDVENCLLTNFAKDRTKFKGVDSWFKSRQINFAENNQKWIERANHRTDTVENIEGLGEVFCVFCSEDITITTSWAYKFNYPGTSDFDYAHIRCCHMRFDFEQYMKNWGKLNKKFAEWLSTWGRP